ncbi:MAG: FtsQ-type POTRA domain-containing protein [Candidatus Latescibacteria bacterium]|nr:FtsQ-type POTRA domain-containing protein [Candidatus Latescibacterota bacterium]
MKRNWKSTCTRMLQLVAVVALVIVSGVYAVSGGRALTQWMGIAPEFVVQEITVYGNELVNTDELVTISGFSTGSNIFMTDLHLAASRLMRDPRLADVFIRRDYPARLAIHVREKQPIAYIQLERLYGLDDEANLIPLATSARLPDLPIITGCREVGKTSLTSRDEISSIEDNDVMYSAIQAIYIVEKLGAYSQDLLDGISEIHMARRDDPVLFTTGDAMAIRIGIGGLFEKLSRLEQIMTRLDQDGIRTPTVDLRFKDQVIIQPIVSSIEADT